MYFFKRLFIISGFCLLVLSLPDTWAQRDDYLIEDRIEAAQMYMQQQKWDFSNYHWRLALSHDPQNVTAILGLAQTLYKSGYTTDAIQHLQSFQNSITEPSIALALADLYSKVGNYQEATQTYQTVLSKIPFQINAYKGLIQLYQKLPKSQQLTVKQDLERMAQKANFKAHKALNTGQYRQAADLFELVAIHTGKAGARNNQALAEFLAGDKQAAAASFEQIVSTNKKQYKLKANAAMVALSHANLSGAVTLMGQSIAECPEITAKAILYNNLGYIYETGKSLTKARYAYERALEINPSFTKAQINLGYIYQRLGEHDKAIALYQSLLSREPHNASAWNQLGFTYELLDKYKQALQAYKSAIQHDPTFRDAYYNLAVLFKKQDQIDESNRIIKQLSELEFAKLEKGSTQTSQVHQSELLNYVDLFFSETM